MINLKELNTITESILAQGRYMLIRRKLNYFKYFNLWKKNMDSILKLVDPITFEEMSNNS